MPLKPSYIFGLKLTARNSFIREPVGEYSIASERQSDYSKCAYAPRYGCPPSPPPPNDVPPKYAGLEPSAPVRRALFHRERGQDDHMHNHCKTAKTKPPNHSTFQAQGPSRSTGGGWWDDQMWGMTKCGNTQVCHVGRRA